MDGYKKLYNSDKIDINNDGIIDEMSAFESYIYDVSMVDDIEIEYRDLLIDEIIKITSKLNQLFIVVGCDNLKFDSGRYAWIVDKVEYSLKSNALEDTKKMISKLYNEFIEKRNLLLNSYLKFVIYIVKEYYKSYGVSFEELVQFGNLGLIRAIETYNYDYNIKFITYADKWIRQSIMSNSKKIMYEVRKPSHIYELNNKRIKAINELSCKLGYIPSDKEVSEYMGVSLDKIELVKNTFLDSISLDEEIELSYDDVYMTRKDSLVDDKINIEEQVICNGFTRKINECLDDFLNEKQKLVIKYIYFDDLNNAEIALKLGVSQQRIGQIHYKALTKLAGKCKVKELRKTYFEC